MFFLWKGDKMIYQILYHPTMKREGLMEIYANYDEESLAKEECKRLTKEGFKQLTIIKIRGRKLK